jgi:hypothetical protein
MQKIEKGRSMNLLEEIDNAHEKHCDILNSKVDIAIFRDINCGLKSNIPVCCILFFCIIWRTLYFFITFSLVKKFIYWYPPHSPEECNYIPCFVCYLLRRDRKLYVCAENDVTCCCFNKAKLIPLSEERVSK